MNQRQCALDLATLYRLNTCQICTHFNGFSAGFVFNMSMVDLHYVVFSYIYMYMYKNYKSISQ